MNEPSSAIPPPGDAPFFFRRRTADETADIHQEGGRLIEEARAARKQWLAAQARTARVQRGIGQIDPSEGAGQTHRLPREEREAHGLSKLALERALARSRWLEDEVIAVQDQERARLARELHDGVSQNLVAIALLLEMHLRQLQELGPDSRPVQSGRKLSEILDRTVQEMRGLAHGLAGIEPNARDGEFCAALHAMAGRLNGSGSVRCVVVCPVFPALGDATATHLYRIAQEAVNNAVRHGKAEHIEIGLARVKGRWRLSVTDDGVGVAESALTDGRGLGMRSIRYRAAVIGGTLKVRRARTAGDRPGTVVSCTFA